MKTAFFPNLWIAAVSSLLCLLLPGHVFAQQAPYAAKNYNDPVIRVEGHSLYSTHGDFFNGVSTSYITDLRPRWRAGISLQYSAAPTHDDNGWKLYRLRFVPVCLNFGYNLLHSRTTALYAELEPGLSFVKYEKQEADPAIPQYTVRKNGLYLYAGMGVSERLAQSRDATFGLGIKNFQLSFNNLDVNPHGIAARAGLQYHLHTAHG